MEKALVSLALTTDVVAEVKEAAPLPTPADQVPNGLRGVSKSLVDRVRAWGRPLPHKRELLSLDCVGLSDSGKGGPEDEVRHDSELWPGGAPCNDVPAAGAGQDSPECVR